VLLADGFDEELERVTADGQVDLVVDPVGGIQRTAAFRRLAPFGRHLIVGNAGGDDQPFSGDEAWLQTRTVAGLSVGGVAHLRPSVVSEALTAVTSLVVRGHLRQPAPTIEPLENARAVHEAIANRTAPHKTVLSLAG
jgi:NADPH2:quinone reductase